MNLNQKIVLEDYNNLYVLSIDENMRFIWNEDEVPTTWEERLAKKYFEKLYREYGKLSNESCINLCLLVNLL